MYVWLKCDSCHDASTQLHLVSAFQIMLMRYILSSLLVFHAFVGIAQTDFNLTIEEVTLPNAPGLQSYANGQHAGKWLLVGGRKDGLHRRQPFAAFLAADNNVMAYVVDPITLEVWSSAISSLPTAVAEQLQSTNLEFVQRDTVLYIAGGYGYSATQGDHITHARLTAINVPATIDAIITGGSINNHVRSTSDLNMAVTGGYMHLLNDRFYLVCGQYFEGRYNPMGPNQGPGFIQQYTEAIRSFDVVDNGTSLVITNYTETVDAANLHRRDYNMVPQVFPNGDAGFTVFSGVFQPDADLPWHNTVDITANGYTVNNSFNQMLSQYHSAHLPIYNATTNAMHTLFFGGMSRYHYDAQSGNLIDDQAVPFVKTISLVSRQANGVMEEIDLDLDMPALLGSGAEFIALESAPYLSNGILDLANLPSGAPTLVGHIFGGIESSAENIFFVNDGTQSWASTRLFRVFIAPEAATSIKGTALSGNEIFEVETYPNPVLEKLTVKITSPYPTSGTLQLVDTNGKVVFSTTMKLESAVLQETIIDCGKLAPGNYIVKFDNSAFVSEAKVVVKR